jgi:hypothetical protein
MNGGPQQMEGLQYRFVRIRYAREMGRRTNGITPIMMDGEEIRGVLEYGFLILDSGGERSGDRAEPGSRSRRNPSALE